MLSLDEIGEDSKQAVETCAYSIANGRGRLQGSGDGGNRPEVRFRVLAVSSGEMTLKAHFKRNGREIMAGHIVRCPSIPHKLETSHSFESFKAFADHKDKENALKHADALYTAFLGELHKQHTMTAQTSRTARLFAISATGLMLASEWGISGISVEQAQAGIKTAFADWYAEQPQGDIEDTALREKVVSTMPQLMGLFVPLEMAKNPSNYPKDYVGFVEKGAENMPDIFDMLVSRFDELFDCNDSEKRKRALNLLGNDMRWLVKDHKRRTWRQRRIIDGQLFLVYRFWGLTPPPEPFIDED